MPAVSGVDGWRGEWVLTCPKPITFVTNQQQPTDHLMHLFSAIIACAACIYNMCRSSMGWPAKKEN